MSGVTRPCGPCSEIYYDFHPDEGYVNADLGDGSRFIELYNLVFMQYNKKDDGSLEPLQQKNIDTGMGLERMAQVLQKFPNNYETDLIFPIIEKAPNLAMISYANTNDVTKANLKIIGDHMRAVCYLISDGVVPSNVGRGYVVRTIDKKTDKSSILNGTNDKISVVQVNKVYSNSSKVVYSDTSRMVTYDPRQVYARYIKFELWDASTGQGFTRYAEHEKRVGSVDFSPVDPTKLASRSDDCSVKLWSHKKRKIRPVLKGLSPLLTNHDKTAFSPMFEDVSFNEVDTSQPRKMTRGSIAARPGMRKRSHPTPDLKRGEISS